MVLYHLLHRSGRFPSDAPSTIRAFRSALGQRTPEELVDQYQLACRPVRDLLVDYLRERQPSVDYATLRQLGRILGGLFWSDLEQHHPEIESLRLAPAVAAAWKQRLQMKATAVTDAAGNSTVRVSVRESARSVLIVVRAFYLDLAQWAVEDPARWAQWAVPSPITAAETNRRKERGRQKSRADQRTRERLPVLPVLVRVADQRRRDSSAVLEACRAAPPGTLFAAAGETLRRSQTRTGHGLKVWAEEADAVAAGTRRGRRDLSFEEYDAFWAWAAIEVLRHTGIRIEELGELSHHSFIQYTLPTTGEVVPLLQIAPSKTDQERLLLISPELADVLSQIVLRVRDDNGAVPLVAAYDSREKVWNPPMPLLFQHRVGVEHRSIPASGIRKMLNRTLTATGLTDASGHPLRFQPHDFRRIFITDAIMNGLPPHIAQIVAGHSNINSTMGYKAVYPMEAIEAHRAFIARRRATRPGEEYRTPTDEEGDAFLGHFEKRKVSIGTCGRAFATPCIHEHACVRCSLLRPDPAQRARLIDIRENLVARIAEAEREGWLGELEGLQVSLAGAEEKLAALDRRSTRTVDLGFPSPRRRDSSGD